MPATDSPHQIIARFLQANGHYETLETFLNEVGVSRNEIKHDGITLEQLLDERRLYDIGSDDDREKSTFQPKDETSWVSPHPKVPMELKQPAGRESNVLVLLAAQIHGEACVVATFADKTVRIYTLAMQQCLYEYSHLHGSPIISVAVSENSLITAGMDGRVRIASVGSGTVVQNLTSHQKYAVRIAVCDEGYLATAGYDKRVHIYRRNLYEDKYSLLGTLRLESNPEAILFVPFRGEQVLLLSRRDSSILYYHSLRTNLPLLTSFNTSEATSHVSYNAADMAIRPGNKFQVGLVTTSVPMMRFMMLDHQHSEPRLMLNVRAGAQQDNFSTPRFSFRPSGGSIWVNGDDGIVRGIDPHSGRIVCELSAHKGRVKAICSTHIGGKEILLTGGIADKSIRIWQCEK